MKYQLPIVEELQEIGYKFKYDTLIKQKEYTMDFVKENRSEVVDVVLPWFDILEFDEMTEVISISSNYVASEILDRIIRLKDGFIEKSDYYFKIHPKFHNDHHVLLKFWKKQLLKICIDSQLIMYDQSLFNIIEDDAFNLVFYNELLRFIIMQLPMSEFLEEDDPFDDINSEIRDLQMKIKNHAPINSKLMDFKLVSYLLSLQRCYDQKYEEMFSQNQTVEQKAVRIYHKLQKHTRPYELHECTNIEEKEAVLRYYLRKQSDNVTKSKNTRGTGQNQKRADKIIQYAKDNPNASIKQVADALNVNWRTVKKYMN